MRGCLKAFGFLTITVLGLFIGLVLLFGEFQVSFHDRSVYIGVIEAHSIHQLNIMIDNPGQEPLTLEEVIHSDSCSVETLLPVIVDPDESLELRMIYTAPYDEGSFHEAIEVHLGENSFTVNLYGRTVTPPDIMPGGMRI